VGTHLITAVYSGDSNYNGSTSPAITLTITPAPPGGGSAAQMPGADNKAQTWFSLDAQRRSVMLDTIGIIDP
jgi:hypothetical protein